MPKFVALESENVGKSKAGAFSLDSFSQPLQKKSYQIYLWSGVCPVPEGSLFPLIFFFFCLFHSDPNPKTRCVLFWFVGVSPETCVVKRETHGVFGGAVSRRKVEAG